MTATAVSLTAVADYSDGLVAALHTWVDRNAATLRQSRAEHQGHELLVRIAFTTTSPLDRLRAEFTSWTATLPPPEGAGEQQRLRWWLSASSGHRILLMVSRPLDSAAELLGQHVAGILGGAPVVSVVSDQQLARSLDGYGGVPFTRIPTSPSTQDGAETRLLRLITAMRVTVVVLARYTPDLSTTLLAELARLGVAVLTLDAGDSTQLAGSHYAAATVRLVDQAGGHILDQRFWRRPNNPTVADEARLERRGGQLLAETLAAWLDGRVLVTETTAEIL